MFKFKMSTNPLTQATAGAAATVFIVGMLLLGFAAFIYLIQDLVGIIVAVLFLLSGISTIGFSIKLLIASKRINDMENEARECRENVKIHQPQDHDDQ